MRERGFTLLELLIALSIVAALLAILMGSLRVGLSTWTRGAERAEAHQHLRSLAELVSRSIAGIFPYRMASQPGGDPVIQFKGESGQLAFATSSPPFPLGPTIAFTAVTLRYEGGERPGLLVREKALPNTDPFEPVLPVFVDPDVTELSFRYLSPDGQWEEQWDAEAEDELPHAVEIRLAARINGRVESLPLLTVPIRTGLK